MILSKKALSIKPSPTLSIDAKAKKMKAEGIDIISFGAGEPDFDTPLLIREAAIKAINDGFTRYTPAAGIIELRRAICEKLKQDNNLDYSVENIVVSNGAKHAIMNALQALCNTGDEVIVIAPYWVSYCEMIGLSDAVPVIVETSEEDEFKCSAKELEKAITEKTKAIILNSPCNPTGITYTREELQEIAEVAVKHNVYVISDEIYEKLVYDGRKHVSIASLDSRIKDLTIVINGMSKAYAMTGWRIGYSASNSKVAAIMANIQSHCASNSNSIAQKASVTALSGSQNELIKMVDEFCKRRDYMVQRINLTNGLSCLKPEGAFYVMVNIQKLIGRTVEGIYINSADAFAEILLEKFYVAVVPGTAFGCSGYIRLSYAASMDNIAKGLDRLEEFVSKFELH